MSLDSGQQPACKPQAGKPVARESRWPGEPEGGLVFERAGKVTFPTYPVSKADVMGAVSKAARCSVLLFPCFENIPCFTAANKVGLESMG